VWLSCDVDVLLCVLRKAQAAREENAEGQEDDHAADTDKDEEVSMLRCFP